MHCITCTLKRKIEKRLLFKPTLKSRSTCLACQHYRFDAKKSLDRERPFSLALRVVSIFSCLSCLAPSVTRVATCVSHVLLDRLQKKERLLVVYVPISINSFQLIVVSLKPLTGVDSGSLSFLHSGCTLSRYITRTFRSL